MNLRTLVAITGFAISALAPSAWAGAAADTHAPPQKMIDLAGHPVPVVAGGLYDRYRSNPPLSIIQKESPTTDLSWFRTLQKTKVDIGFESYSPNFYYENTLVTAVFTADIERLRELMPAKVLEQVQPIQIWPGRGLVALTAYAYHYCDNDSYNEFALSIVVNQPGKANLGPISLVGQVMSKDMWGYVLKLPVDTELARVRGVVGYNLPKWLTKIDYRKTESSVIFEIADAKTGARDLVLETRKLDDVSSEPSLVKNSFINLNRAGQLSSGYAVSRKMSHGSSLSADSVKLQLSDGSLSTFIKSLKLGRMIQYQYVPSFQSALYAPKPLVVPFAK